MTTSKPATEASAPPQACETPLSDLRAQALKHYEEVSNRSCSWSSDIPRAINFYYDAEEAKAAASPVAPRAAPAPEKCAHCWHQWGPASGGISSDGSTTAHGQNRCCHCGEIERYDWSTKPAKPVGHGPFYSEILRFPA